MQVKIDLNSFNGHAELSGVELDNLTKILVKFFGTDQRYLDGRYIQVKTGQKLAAKLEISTDTEFMSESAYKLEKEQSDAKAAALAEEQRLERADLAARLYADTDNETIQAEVDSLLGTKHGLFYWNERTSQHAHRAFYSNDDGVTFIVGPVEKSKIITLGLDGSFKRVDFSGHD